MVEFLWMCSLTYWCHSTLSVQKELCLQPWRIFLCVRGSPLPVHDSPVSLQCLVLFLRCAASRVWGAEPLVLYCLLWTQQSRRRGLSCLVYQRAGGWLHWPFKQQEPLLPRTAVQCQPQLHNREYTQTHRQRYNWSTSDSTEWWV